MGTDLKRDGRSRACHQVDLWLGGWDDQSMSVAMKNIKIRVILLKRRVRDIDGNGCERAMAKF